MQTNDLQSLARSNSRINRFSTFIRVIECESSLLEKYYRSLAN